MNRIKNASTPMMLLALLWIFASCSIQAANDGEITPAVGNQWLDEAALGELVGPVALYSDTLLALVLPASTYPLQIVAATRFHESSKTNSGIEPDDNWDESIVALLNYPEALNQLNEDLEWTWALGQAVATQQEDVITAIKAFREAALAAGNLKTDEHQIVNRQNGAVTIASRDPEVVHVPYYAPEAVTVYQPQPVYHYYPTPYPLYFYPYDYGHAYYNYDYRFWGISSMFALSWHDNHLGHYTHRYHRHPYYDRRYNHNHYRRTQKYNRFKSRKHHHHKQKNRQRWQPDERYSGARPNHRNRSDRPRHRGHTRHDQSRPNRQQRNTDANNHRSRASAHRPVTREINSVQQTYERSTVHRPKADRRETFDRHPNRSNARTERRNNQNRPNLNRSSQSNRPQQVTQVPSNKDPKARNNRNSQKKRKPQRPPATPRSPQRLPLK